MTLRYPRLEHAPRWTTGPTASARVKTRLTARTKASVSISLRRTPVFNTVVAEHQVRLAGVDRSSRRVLSGQGTLSRSSSNQSLGSKALPGRCFPRFGVFCRARGCGASLWRPMSPRRRLSARAKPGPSPPPLRQKRRFRRLKAPSIDECLPVFPLLFASDNESARHLHAALPPRSSFDANFRSLIVACAPISQRVRIVSGRKRPFAIADYPSCPFSFRRASELPFGVSP